MNVLDPTSWNNAAWLATPLVVVLIGTLSALLVSAFARGGRHTPRIVAIISLASLALAFLFTWGDWLSGSDITAGMLTFDRITYIGWLLIFFATALVVMLSLSYLPSESRRKLRRTAKVVLYIFWCDVLRTIWSKNGKRSGCLPSSTSLASFSGVTRPSFHF